MKRFLCIAVMAASLFSSTAQACGDVFAVRGGIAVRAGERSVELVRDAAGWLRVFIDDHGTAVQVQGSNGSLDITRNGQTTTYPLLPLADGSAVRTEAILPAPGDALQVIVNMEDGQVVVAELQFQGFTSVPHPEPGRAVPRTRFR